jgi:prefoldin beta subunit
MEMSEEMQGKLMQFQQLQQQIQVIATQKYQIDVQVAEIERTMEELDKLTKGAVLYKSVGSLLMSVDDKDALKTQLEEKKETLGIRAKTLGNQEKSLRDRYQELQEELTKALSQTPQAG